MKKITIALLLIVYFSSASFAQETGSSKVPGQNSFYAELGGPGILFSANFDRRFTRSHLGFGGRAGIGFVSGDFDENSSSFNTFPQSVITVPLQLNYIFGKNNSVHTFEVGLGATFLGRKIDIFDFYDEQRTQIFGTASFMYRRQPKNGGFSWRGGLTPLIAKGYIQPFAGFSVGYTF
ncbi:MAG: hypothetical protein H7Z13_13865 [Ferruginibacter sp.]|nr:hypothetical protein [Ferruginibacter sp.]